jgi:hypothetical protein
VRLLEIPKRTIVHSWDRRYNIDMNIVLAKTFSSGESASMRNGDSVLSQPFPLQDPVRPGFGRIFLTSNKPLGETEKGETTWR